MITLVYPGHPLIIDYSTERVRETGEDNTGYILTKVCLFLAVVSAILFMGIIS